MCSVVRSRFSLPLLQTLKSLDPELRGMKATVKWAMQDHAAIIITEVRMGTSKVCRLFRAVLWTQR